MIRTRGQSRKSSIAGQSIFSYDFDNNDEVNNDGESHNRGWNCGAEGPTDDETINAVRARQQRNMPSTLMLSQGVPMMLGGDEIGRSQGDSSSKSTRCGSRTQGTENASFTIPSDIADGVWRVLLDSVTGLVDDPDADVLKPGDTIDLPDHSTVLLELTDELQ